MRSMWKGSISFGLVTIPVKLYTATEQRDVTFRQVHAADGGRITARSPPPGSASGCPLPG